MSGIQAELDKLNKEAEEKKVEADRLVRLFAEFPDLRKHVGRWNKVAYCSASVNSRVDKADFRYNCGCCSDSPLEVWPYLETASGKVYSDPPCFQVGEKYYLGGSRPYPNWKERMSSTGVSEVVVIMVQNHFESCKRDRILAAMDDTIIEDPEPFV